jgi:uncharacterized zinc-type alcohol dehydrogenase-like protein
MPNKVRGYAVQSAGAPVGPHDVTRRDPRADDVTIDILYCGVCHTDIHHVRNDWGRAVYPLVPGHEIIGRVAAVGSAVKGFKPGDTVGVGCLVDSCRTCSACEEDLEQHCETGATWTYNDVDRHDQTRTYGGYSERILVSERFVIPVPAGMELNSAAPLLCAGITLYSPLRRFEAGPGKRVAIVALGGLGHMGIKLAKAMGAEVTLFTRVAGQEQEARRLGADHVIMITDPQQMAAAAARFDLIVDTVPSDHDINPYVATLARGGTYVIVGQFTPLHTPVMPGAFIDGRRSLAGSLIGGLAETREMLEFCAAHGITCDVEMIRMQDINTAYERMLKGDVRYRFVIDMASLKGS